MSGDLTICEVSDDLKDLLKKFRFKSGNNAALVMKVNKSEHTIVLDEAYEDTSIDELREELDESQPRYIVFSYKYEHDDGRTSFPMCFIYISPAGCNPQLNMLYAGSKHNVVNQLELTKVYEIRSTDELTEDWLKQKLKLFS